MTTTPRPPAIAYWIAELNDAAYNLIRLATLIEYVSHYETFLTTVDEQLAAIEKTRAAAFIVQPHDYSIANLLDAIENELERNHPRTNFNTAHSPIGQFK